MLQSAFFRKYLLPGFVLQSMVIAGGYGTGRELVEFFLKFGAIGGLLGMWLVSVVIWCAVCAVTFDLARLRRAYDYRTFSRELLGPFWWLYEICYLIMMLIILSVIAAAAGSIVQQLFSAPYFVGVVLIMVAVGFLVLKGTSLVERVLSLWSLVLYAVYIVFLIACVSKFGDDIASGLKQGDIKPGWLVGGLKYAAYNLGMLPVVLFAVRHIERRKEAFIAGVLAGPITMLPGFFFYLTMVGRYPAIVSETVPSVFLLEELGSRLFLFVFQIMLLGTLVETGTGMIHAFNERLATALEEKGRKLAAGVRPVGAVVLLLLAAIVAQVGLENLIANGYGTATYGFWIVFLIPVLTIGVYKIATIKEPAPAK